MKYINTSYYAMQKKLPQDRVQICVARKPPFWWNPPNRLIASAFGMPHEMQQSDWKRLYPLRLREMFLSKDSNIQPIEDIPDGAILLCYEKDPAMCHRTLILNFLIEHFEFEGKEFTFDDSQFVLSFK